MAQMECAIHVGIGEGHKVLVLMAGWTVVLQRRLVENSMIKVE